MTKYIYRFGEAGTDGDATMKDLLGGKGAHLAEMSRMGLPAPPGFTITTDVCRYYHQHELSTPPELDAQVLRALENVEQQVGRRFGCVQNPLLVSVRSGARESMPGMLDTVLCIGLNDQSVEGLAGSCDVPQQGRRFAWDCYRRLLQMYGNVVLGLKPAGKQERDPFEKLLLQKRTAAGVQADHQLSADQLAELVAAFKGLIRERAKADFPQDPYVQLAEAIRAVFRSWMNDRAVVYRRTYGIPHDWGTAVTVMAMVYGNLGDDCAAGVAFTRSTATGENGLNGDYLINSQGEDVVSGGRPTLPISPQAPVIGPVYSALAEYGKRLEKRFADVQDMEFAVERGKLWMLQTRSAKRTGHAAVHSAVGMVREGLISREEALLRVPADDLTALLRPRFRQQEKAKARRENRLLSRKGVNASPGAASGQICFHAEDAERIRREDPRAELILVRQMTAADDIRGMKAADGVLTATGGASSHPALVARQLGRPCITSCQPMVIDESQRTVTVGDTLLKEGDVISIDGGAAEVFQGKLATEPSEVAQVLQNELNASASAIYLDYHQLMNWAERYRRLRVRVNCDLPDQARDAVRWGAEGIGLCRTEHTFFEHLEEFRELILAEDPQQRQHVLSRLLEVQRSTFAGLFRVMEGRPTTIRLLDPPLHEFLPHDTRDQQDLARRMGVPALEVARRVERLQEPNPMLGHRGCRLGITFPEIVRMQVQAILEAACRVFKSGIPVCPELIVPLVGFDTEFRNQQQLIHESAWAVFQREGVVLDYGVGAMIEVPRAAITADELAQHAEFFSFGTNDLTQLCLGADRDACKFLDEYLEQDIVPANFFQTLDQKGVGQLVRMAVERGSASRPEIGLGLCGEHAGDPASVVFCEQVGMDYVSCDVSRLPVARLAAAQAALRSADRRQPRDKS